MKIFVTGVNGQLGYEIVKELNNKGYNNILAVDKDDVDITDENKVKEIIRN